MIFGKITLLRKINKKDRFNAIRTEYYVDKVDADENPIQVIWRYIPGDTGGYMTPAEPPEVEVVRAIDLKTCCPVARFEEDEALLEALEDVLFPIGEERWQEEMRDMYSIIDAYEKEWAEKED